MCEGVRETEKIMAGGGGMELRMLNSEEKNKEEEKDNCKTQKSTRGEVYADTINSKLEQSLRLERSTRNSKQLFENLTWLTSNEAAEYLRLPSVGILRVLVCQRKVPFHKLGRNLRFKRGDLDRLLEASRNGGI
jgi:excisionase family DNA binding protein